MASTHPFNPVMHCCTVEFQAVNVFATRIITEGMYVNTSLFTTIPVTLSTFEAANAKLTDLISQAKGNSNIIMQRDEQSGIVHEYMAQLLCYAHIVCNHDIEKIILSGFDASNQPQPAVPPPIPVITKVAEGKESGTYKIFLKRTNRKKLGVSGKSHSKGENRYYRSNYHLHPMMNLRGLLCWKALPALSLFSQDLFPVKTIFVFMA